MNMEKKEFLRILEKYRRGQTSAEEEKFLQAYYNLFDARDNIVENFSSTEKNELKDRIRKDLMQQIASGNGQVKQKKTYVSRWAAAAAILIVMSFATWSLIKQDPAKGVSEGSYSMSKVRNTDIAPGGNKATLTLADGSVIALDEAASGTLASQNGVSVNKTQEGEIVYRQASKTRVKDQSIAYNTISIPRGGQYQLRLPDGSEVWLNSSSSIRFPTVFTGDERRVKLTGEAYFEVAKRFKGNGSSRGERLPFIVKTPDQEVEVLGTHFNINAYEDEAETRTTLLEGSVRVRAIKSFQSSGNSLLLVPGQQSVLRTSDQSISVHKADLEKAIAWKNGYFKFDREDIQSVMRQVSRWYDVDVEYRGRIPQDEFVGKIKRTSYVSGVLRILELSNVSCRIEGRKIIVGNN